tara:strand:+ start:79 stop:525 length:447 start_codon:yes stop_codon:yes gene_type:complete
MTRVAIVDQEGIIEQLYTSGVNVEPEGAWRIDNTKTVVHLSPSDDTDTFLELRYYKDGAWKERTKAPGIYYDWKDEAWALNSTRLWEEIRKERNQRLLKCDWTQTTDSPLTDEKKANWVSYREALRAVPLTNSEVTHLDQVIWPDQPS